MLIDAEFITVWNTGVELRAPCKVDIQTREIVFIGIAQIPHGSVLGTGIGEYVEIDGTRCPVIVRSDVREPVTDVYWYR